MQTDVAVDGLKRGNRVGPLRRYPRTCDRDRDAGNQSCDQNLASVDVADRAILLSFEHTYSAAAAFDTVFLGRLGGDFT